MRMGKTSDLLQAGEQLEIVARDIAISAFAGAVARNGTVSFVVPANEQRTRAWDGVGIRRIRGQCQPGAALSWNRCL